MGAGCGCIMRVRLVVIFAARFHEERPRLIQIGIATGKKSMDSSLMGHRPGDYTTE